MAGKSIKKKIVLLVIYIILGLIAGAIIGAAFDYEYLREHSGAVLKAIKENGYIPAAVIFLSVNTTLCVISAVKYFNAKKKLVSVADDDDDGFIAVEQSLNVPSLLSGILTIITLTLGTVIFYFGVNSTLPEKFTRVSLLILIVIYLFFFFFSFFLNRSIYELLKKINPEKTGDLFEMDFVKSWKSSCDEAQKLIMYKAAYKAFNTVKTICACLWLMCFLSQVLFDTGILPGLCIGIIYLTATISYSKEIMKQGR